MLIEDFTTQRLGVTAWRTILQCSEQRTALEQDLALILTPNVLAPLPEPLQMPRGTSQIAAWIQAREAESDVFSVSDLNSGLLLGLLILAHDDAQTVHLGYMLADAAWGRGYATEVIRGLLRATPEGQGVTFVAGVNFDNPASYGVLLKCGFAISQELSAPGTRFYTYTVA